MLFLFSMEDINSVVQESFEEKVKALKETLDTLDDWKYEMEDKLRKLDNKLNFVKDDISYLEK